MKLNVYEKAVKIIDTLKKSNNIKSDEVVCGYLDIARQTFDNWRRYAKNKDMLFEQSKKLLFSISSTIGITSKVWEDDFSHEDFKRLLFIVEKRRIIKKYKSKSEIMVKKHYHKYLGIWYGYSFRNPEIYTSNTKDIWKSKLEICFNETQGYFANLDYSFNLNAKAKANEFFYRSWKIRVTRSQLFILFKADDNDELLTLSFPDRTKLNVIIGLYNGLVFTSKFPISGRILISKKELLDEQVKGILGKKEVITIRQEHIDNCSPKDSIYI